MDIEDSSAIVTGSASGLGLATAAALAAAGSQVVGLDRDVALAPRIPGLTYMEGDVTDADDVRAAVQQTAELGPLRIVVNCAGIGPSARILSRSRAHDLGLYARVIAVNLVGTFTVLTLAAEKMATTEPLDDGMRGIVINTASAAAFEGQVGQAAYASSKGGVVALTLPAARDLAQYGIRVNTIAPGLVETPMLATVGADVRLDLAAGVPFPRRLGRPAEFAQLVCSLVANDYINGETIRMDGALRMAPR